MRAPILIFLFVSLGLVLVPVHAQNSDDAILLEFYFTPKTDHMQMEYGETYIFAVNVVNQNLDIEKDDVVDPDEPYFRFSGNVVLDTFFTVRRRGSYRQGSETVHFNVTLDSRDETYDILLPEIGSSSIREDSYTCEIGYGGKGANMDEWLTFSMDVYAYLEEYRNVSGVKKYYIGDLLSEAHLTFYIISDEKANFVNDVLKSLNQDITMMKNAVANIEDELNEELDIDLTAYEDIYSAMKAYIDDGDYVSAMKEYSGYDPTWKDDVITLLQQRVESLKASEQLLMDYSDQFSKLTADYQALQVDYENITASHLAQVGELNSELTSVKSRGRLYLFAMVALAVASIIIVLRVLFRKS